MSGVNSSFSQMSHSMRTDMQDFRPQAAPLFMSDMPKPQPPLRRERDQGLPLFDNRMMNDNFHYHSDNSEEENKHGSGNKAEDQYSRNMFPVMMRPPEVTQSRPSLFTFQTNSEMATGIPRLNMGPPTKRPENHLENQYRKMDFSHNNQF